jgi:hypothetical protein
MFHPLRWANATVEPLQGVPWPSRKLLGLVASGKLRTHRAGRNARETAKLLRRHLWFKYLHMTNSFFRFPDLYSIRLEYIRRFAARSEFVLFGRGWDRNDWIRRELGDVAFAVEPVPCQNKMEALSRFRFSLCIENCVFPGYVTEKLFDGIFAGTVPVYLGAPDIETLIAKDVYVDAREFATPDDLWRRLAAMPREEWERRREAAQDFLASEAYGPFREETMATQILAWIESCT